MTPTLTAATDPQAAPTSPDQGTWRRDQVLTLVSVVIAQLMIVLDMTVIAVALPRMQEDLAMTSAERPWVVTAYGLTFGGLVLAGGRLTAVLGKRRSYRVALSGFALASLVGGLAPGFGVLVAARAVQGCFAALLAPVNLALTSTTFPSGAARTRAYSVLGATGGLGAAIGLLVGGAVTDALSWRWTLYVNIPIAALALLVSLRSLAPDKGLDHPRSLLDDALGLVLGCTAVFAAVFGFDRAEQESWGSASTLVCLGAGAACAVGFVLRERTARRPVLPLSVVAQSARAAAYVSQLAVGAAQMGAVVYLTYYFQNHFGYSPLRTGFLFLPMVGALVVTAVAAGRLLVQPLGATVLLPAGLLVMAGSFTWLSRVEVDSTYAQVALPGLIVLGVGLGLMTPVAFNAGTRGVPPAMTGIASSVLSASQQIGGSFSVALLATYATHRVEDYVSSHSADVQAQAAAALARAGAAPDSDAGRTIIAALRGDLADQAQVTAYAGGFALLAWIMVAVGAALVVGAVARRLRRRR